MWWGNYSLMWQLAKLIPEPRVRTSGKETARHNGPNEGFGCCPACHDFVRVESWGPSGTAICPSCERLIRSLEPLGAGE